MSSSSCPRCGWALRWLQEQGAWGCDRCRTMVPPQQVAQQQQQVAPQQQQPYAPAAGSPYAPHAPHGAPHAPHGAPPGPGYPVPAPRPRSSKGLVIGLGLGAIAIAGTIAGVMLTRGGGSGVESGDELVKRTLAAVSEGDVEKLVKLSDPVGLHDRTLDCSERDKAKPDADKEAADGEPKGMRDGMRDGSGDEAADELDDPQIQEKRLRRKHEKLVEKMKGLKIELVSIEAVKDKDGEQEKDGGAAERAKGKGMKKGDPAMKGCVLKVDVEVHALVAKLRITAPDAKAPSDGEAQLMAVEAGGSWFLWAPPTIRAGSGALATKLRKYRDLMCKCTDAACAEVVDKEGQDWARSARGEAKDLPQDELKELDEIDAEMKVCREKLREAGKQAVVEEALAKLLELKTKMCACADRACTERVEKEMTDWSKAMSGTDKDVKPSADQERQLMESVKAYAECQIKATGADEASKPGADPMPPEEPSGGTTTSSGAGADPSSGPSSGAGAGPSSGPSASSGTRMSSVPACAAYRRQIDQIGTCTKYPRSAVDAMKQGYAQMEKSWATASSNAQFREQMTKSCAASADALKKAREAMCP